MDPRAFARFKGHRGALIGTGIVVFLVVFAAFGPALLGLDPLTSDFERGQGSEGGPAEPSLVHWLGTDAIYRDQLARLAYGARHSIAISVAASALSLFIGTVAGVVSGFWHGKGVRTPLFRVSIDDVVMRFVDIGLCFPFLLLVMAIGAAVDETTAFTIFVVLGSTSWLGTARIVRAETLKVRDLEFVTAARALGARPATLLLRHIVPNVAGTLVVLGTLSIAQMILAESALSYLNLGLPPPAPSWGRMLQEGQRDFASAPWLLAGPGGAILTAVIGFNLLGEGVRDALDPRQERS